MNNDRKSIVDELISMIRGGNAHATLEDAVEGVNIELIGKIPEHLPYGLWHVLEHMRITQSDILEFCLDPSHQSPEWPEGYWPEKNENVKPEQWETTLAGFRKDQERFIELLKDEQTDLYQAFSHGSGQNIFREALLIGDHNAYHTGELIVIRRLLGNWKS